MVYFGGVAPKPPEYLGPKRGLGSGLVGVILPEEARALSKGIDGLSLNLWYICLK